MRNLRGNIFDLDFHLSYLIKKCRVSGVFWLDLWSAEGMNYYYYGVMNDEKRRKGGA